MGNAAQAYHISNSAICDQTDPDQKLLLGSKS